MEILFRLQVFIKCGDALGIVRLDGKRGDGRPMSLTQGVNFKRGLGIPNWRIEGRHWSAAPLTMASLVPQRVRRDSDTGGEEPDDSFSPGIIFLGTRGNAGQSDGQRLKE